MADEQQRVGAAAHPAAAETAVDDIAWIDLDRAEAETAVGDHLLEIAVGREKYLFAGAAQTLGEGEQRTNVTVGAESEDADAHAARCSQRERRQYRARVPADATCRERPSRSAAVAQGEGSFLDHPAGGGYLADSAGIA